MPYRRLAFRRPLLPDGSDGLRLEVRAFLREQEFEPRCDSWLSGFDPEFSRRLAVRGWVGMTWPERYGGHGKSPLDRHVVIEELLAAGAPVAAHWISDRQTGPLLLRYGSEELRERLLPAMARGECYFCIGMSEPDSGSDLASLRATATRVDGGYLVGGTKVWTSHAHRSHYMLALVRTTPGAQRHEGLSQLVIDLSSPGVDVRPIRLLTGSHHFNEVVLRDVHVPRAMLVGREGEGWTQVLTELAFERSGPERILSTFPLLRQAVEVLPSDDARAAEEVGRLTARLLALRRLSLSVAGAIEAGEAPVVEAALVKDLGTRFERDVVESARNLGPDERLGGLLAQAVLSAPGFTLRGGTSEILRGVVARGLLGRSAPRNPHPQPPRFRGDPR
jgi:alkylation response protein AidB-like acyl-CoA dehydrogenase